MCLNIQLIVQYAVRVNNNKLACRLFFSTPHFNEIEHCAPLSEIIARCENIMFPHCIVVTFYFKLWHSRDYRHIVTNVIIKNAKIYDSKPLW